MQNKKAINRPEKEYIEHDCNHLWVWHQDINRLRCELCGAEISMCDYMAYIMWSSAERKEHL